MKALSPEELRCLVGLLDEEDPRSYELVREQILHVGDQVLPYIEERRPEAKADYAARLDAVCRELRFQNLRADFFRLANNPDPDLETGAFLLMRFGYPGADSASLKRWLDEVAAQAVPPGKPLDETERFHRLNTHLFSVMGFAGNELHYYDPDNSFLNRVIERRRGIPVSLCIVYLLLARRLGIKAYGVGTPGHFLVGFKGPEPVYLDPFNKGKLMSAADVQKMLARAGYEFHPQYLAEAPSRDIIIRMMRNLISIYQKMGAADRGEMLSTLVEVMLTRRKEP